MATCRSCGAEIVWAVTERGKRIPLDAKPVGPLFAFDPPLAHPAEGKLHLSHFATCPDAREWSGRQRDA